MTLVEMIEEVLEGADENTGVSVEIVRKPIFDRKTGGSLGALVTRLQINTQRFNYTGPNDQMSTYLLEPLSQEYLEERLSMLREPETEQEQRHLGACRQ